MNEPWGVGAIILLDRDNQFYPFIHVKPELDENIIKQVYDKMRPPGETWTKKDYQIRILAYFVDLVKRYHDGNKMEDDPPSQELAFWVIFLAHVADDRNWLIESDTIDGQPSIKFYTFAVEGSDDPIEGAKHIIDSLVNTIVAKKTRFRPTIH